MLNALQGRAIRTTKRICKPLTRKYYRLARSFGVIELQVSHTHKEPPLVVYQMGKVGSTSIVESLKASSLDMPIFHVHCLTDEGIDYIDSVYKQEFSVRGSIPGHLFDSLYLRKSMKNMDDSTRWKVVTLVRDPIAQHLSSFFQLIRVARIGHQQWQLTSAANDFEMDIDLSNIDQLIAIFLKEGGYDRALDFFNSEFKTAFDFDIFETQFPCSRGYQIYSTQYADILLMRLEDASMCAGEAFQKFLNIEDFQLADQNMGDQKEYAELYAAFKRAIVFSDSYLDKIYGSKLARHFYTDAELDQFRRKWSANQPLDQSS